LRAFARRCAAAGERPGSSRRSSPEASCCVLRPAERSATIDGGPLELRAREFDLLLALASRPNAVLTREILLESVWGRELDVDTRTIDVHVNRLRQRLEGSDVAIETVRGVGYRLGTRDGGLGAGD
jgi:DNA-binding response OmpR family regulator